MKKKIIIIQKRKLDIVLLIKRCIVSVYLGLNNLEMFDGAQLGLRADLALVLPLVPGLHPREPDITPHHTELIKTFIGNKRKSKLWKNHIFFPDYFLQLPF